MYKYYVKFKASNILDHGYIIVLVGTWTTLIIFLQAHTHTENKHNNNDKVNNQQTLPSKEEYKCNTMSCYNLVER